MQRSLIIRGPLVSKNRREVSRTEEVVDRVAQRQSICFLVVVSSSGSGKQRKRVFRNEGVVVKAGVREERWANVWNTNSAV